MSPCPLPTTINITPRASRLNIRAKFVLLSVVRLFANVQENRVSIPGRIIPKIKKMLLNAPLLKTQLYKVQIKGNGSNPGKSVTPSPNLDVVAIEKGAFRSLST